jgi:hypothetical protein
MPSDRIWVFSSRELRDEFAAHLNSPSIGGSVAAHLVELLAEENPRTMALLHRVLPAALMLSLTGMFFYDDEMYFHKT